MVIKEEIVDWFKHQESHKRLDLLCCLLNLCLPFENCFIDAYLQMLIKRDSCSAQDQEVIALTDRNQTPWNVETASISDEPVRRRLIFSLAFLGLEKRREAHLIYKLLYSSRTLEYLKHLEVDSKLPSSCLVKENYDICQELLLIYTMALYHPLFTFEERVRFNEGYVTVMNIVSSRGEVSTCSAEVQATSQPSQSPTSVYTCSSQSSPAISVSETRASSRCTIDSNQSSTSPSRNCQKVERSNASHHFHQNFHLQNGNFKKQCNSSSENLKVTDMKDKCINGFDNLADQLQDQMGRENFSIFKEMWKKLQSYSIPELYSMSDDELLSLGLHCSLIAPLRKVLERNSVSRRSLLNGIQSATNETDGPSSWNSNSLYLQHYPPLRPTDSVSTSKSLTEFSSSSSSRSNSPGDSLEVPSLCDSGGLLNGPTDVSVPAAKSSPISLPSAAPGFAAFPVNFSHQQPPRSCSQPRDLSFIPVAAMSFSGPQQSSPYYVTTNTPPATLDGSVPLLPYLPVGAVSASCEAQQSPYTFITSAPPPGATPRVAVPFPGNFFVRGHFVSQNVPPAMRRPSSVIEMPTFVPSCTIVYSPTEIDFTRPPPSNLIPVVSCFNCGGTGHRGDDCWDRGTSSSEESKGNSS